MADTVIIEQAENLDGNDFVLSLSDGRVLLISLAEVMSLNPRELPDDLPEDY